MSEVFADTAYWVALTNPRDANHRRARTAAAKLKASRIVTSDFVLSEFMNYFSSYGPELRRMSADLARSFSTSAAVLVIPATRAHFLEALELFAARTDKGYSHTDCTSFVIMRERAITEALTTDEHFAQEGFRALLR